MVRWDVVTFEDWRELLVAYWQYEQQIHAANEDGGDTGHMTRRELVYTETQIMVAREFCDGKPRIASSDEELNKRLERFTGVDVQ